MTAPKLSLLLCLLLISLSLGCDTGYQRIDGKWHYVTWNEGTGRSAVPIEANEQTFRILVDRNYASDNKSVFFLGSRIVDAKPDSFYILDDRRYSMDATFVFIEGLRIPGADPASFQILSFPYSKDRTAVYCGNLRMNVDDPDAFFVTREGNILTRTTASNIKNRFPSLSLHIAQTESEVCLYGNGEGTDGVRHYRGPVAVD